MLRLPEIVKEKGIIMITTTKEWDVNAIQSVIGHK